MNAERDAATARRRLLPVLAGLILCLACDRDPTDPDPACTEADVLAFGVTHDPGRTSLGPGDASFDGSFIDYYSVRPVATGTLTIEMAAEVPSDVGEEGRAGVDPFLYLWREGLGPPHAHAHDATGLGPLLRVARLSAEVEPGCYRVGASGWPSMDEGPYTIRADFSPAP
ncbi:MAG: hypothetical protein KY466_01585 [Gemmatimonadetes bacterium]|nr:hypothetical protein [Gemmatimonadota bacterium]